MRETGGQTDIRKHINPVVVLSGVDNYSGLSFCQTEMNIDVPIIRF